MAASASNPAIYRLRIPGPTAVPERVRTALARPIIHHRGPEFRALYARIQDRLRPVLGTSQPIFLFASTGTGAMEAALVNTVAPGESVLAVVNGQFGDRFAQIAQAHGAVVDRLEVEWGRAVDPVDVQRRLDAHKYRAVVVIHNESSTGVVNDLAALGRLTRSRDTLLIVDSVSGLGGLEVRQDDWGVDILVSASQKCLMCPPGLAVICVSSKAWEVVARAESTRRFYWDLRKARASGEKAETPFTAPVAMLAALGEALEMIHAEGLSAVYDRHRRVSSLLRSGGADLGFTVFGQPDALSPTVVVFGVPAGREGGEIVRGMYDRYRTVIAGARNKLAGRVIRIGTMGAITEEDIRLDLEQLAVVLRSM